MPDPSSPRSHHEPLPPMADGEGLGAPRPTEVTTRGISLQTVAAILLVALAVYLLITR